MFVYQSNSASAYTFGTTPAAETVFAMPASKRAFILFGTAPNQYYSFAVQAYRSVDKDINAAGVIKSTLVKATGSGENPIALIDRGLCRRCHRHYQRCIRRDGGNRRWQGQ